VRDDRNRRVPSIKLEPEFANDENASLNVVMGDTDDYCLCVVNVKNHVALAAKRDVDLLPEFPLDSKVGAMHQATKLALRARLVARGLPGSVTDNADGFRDILNHVARTALANPGFDADNFSA
jgi:hypothetical protein